MTRIVSEQRVYLYGRTMDRLGGGEKEDSLTIYVNPEIFDNVKLSSLEGFFVMSTADLSDVTPQLVFRKERTAHIESKYGGRFIPFSD